MRPEQKFVKHELHELHKLWGLSQKDFREIFTAEILSVTGGVIAGMLLAFYIGRLDVLPAILIVLPGFLEMRGSIGGSLSARLSSAMFLGALKPRGLNQRILKGNVAAAFSLSLVVSLVLGLVAYAVQLYLFGVSFPEIVPIMLLAGVLSNVIEMPFTVLITFRLFRKGVDPDNVMGPYITAIGDVVSVVSIFVAAVVMA